MLYRKVNSKWIEEINIRTKTTKLLEELIGANFHELRLGKWFLRCDTKSTNDKREKWTDWITSKFKMFGLQIISLRKRKENPQDERKYLQNVV